MLRRENNEAAGGRIESVGRAAGSLTRSALPLQRRAILVRGRARACAARHQVAEVVRSGPSGREGSRRLDARDGDAERPHGTRQAAACGTDHPTTEAARTAKFFRYDHPHGIEMGASPAGLFGVVRHSCLLLVIPMHLSRPLRQGHRPDGLFPYATLKSRRLLSSTCVLCYSNRCKYRMVGRGWRHRLVDVRRTYLDYKKGNASP